MVSSKNVNGVNDGIVREMRINQYRMQNLEKLEHVADMNNGIN